MELSRFKSRIIGVSLLLAVIALVLVLYPQSTTRIKQFFSKGGNGLIALETIQKEISDSGKLIAGVDVPNAYLTKQGVFTLTNAERTKRGLHSLGSNILLDRDAAIRMKDMFAKQYFEHVSPSGDSASKEADKVGYEYITLGENIALGNFKDDSALVQAWMNSPGHRANILNTKFSEIGIAVGKGMYQGRQTWIAVQVFGKPTTACPTVSTTLKDQIANRESQISTLQNDLNIKKQQLDTERNESSFSQAEYNAQIDTYNAEVEQVNELIAQVKIDIASYNSTVESFNTCLGQTN